MRALRWTFALALLNAEKEASHQRRRRRDDDDFSDASSSSQDYPAKRHASAIAVESNKENVFSPLDW